MEEIDVVAFIDELLMQSIEQGVSDIHLESHVDMLRIRQRMDGFLIETHQLPKEYSPAVISRLKVMSQLDIGERRLPQDGSMKRTLHDIPLDVRISTLPILHGEKVVLRLLTNSSKRYMLEELGMTMDEQQHVRHLFHRSSGLVIVTGPTGSGKTTTLYAMLHELNQSHSNVVTLEDPIELQIPGINQVQIYPKVGLTFAQCLRAVLRQDPDVIMIGEIRDYETASIAIQAALTGHLVLTTLHTVDAASAIIRLLDMGIESYRIAAALQGVIAQRLVRLICKKCQGNGCEHCQETGYKGRVGVFEVVAVDDPLQRMIVDTNLVMEVRSYLRERGIRSLRDALVEQVKLGFTTPSECIRVINDADEIQMEHSSIDTI